MEAPTTALGRGGALAVADAAAARTSDITAAAAPEVKIARAHLGHQHLQLIR